MLFLGLLFVGGRYLATYADCTLHGGFNGHVAISMLWNLGWVLCLQPLLLGLVILSRREWAIGSASLGVSLVGLIVFELLARTKYRSPRLPKEDQDRLRSFTDGLEGHTGELIDDFEETTQSAPSGTRPRRRSNATIYELMSDLLIPSERRRNRGFLPLQTEHIDDLVDPYRANLAHPDIHKNRHELPPLSLRTGDGSDMTRYQLRTMYPTEMIMPVPVVWLPDDKISVGKQEVEDLRRFHRLPAMLDAVRS
jgi:hypothetical protein